MARPVSLTRLSRSRVARLLALAVVATGGFMVVLPALAGAAGPAFVGYCTPDETTPEDGTCVLDEPEGKNPDTYGAVTYDRTVAGAADSLSFDLPDGTDATEVQVCLTLVADSPANPYVPTNANTCAGNSPDRAYSSSSPTDPVVVDVAAFFASHATYVAGDALWFTVHVNGSGRTMYVTGGSAPGEPVTRSLVVTKDVQPDGPGSFAFTVDCDSDLSASNTTSTGVTFTDGNASFSLEDDGSVGFSGIPDGDSCTVTETSPGDGWATTANGAAGNAAIVSLDGANGSAAFVNARLRTLAVTKTVTGSPTSSTDSFDFTVDCGSYELSGANTADAGVSFAGGDASFTLGNNDAVTFTKLPDATVCTVSEVAPTSTGGTWSTTINGDADADRSATATLDQDRTLAYGNAFAATPVVPVVPVAEVEAVVVVAQPAAPAAVAPAPAAAAPAVLAAPLAATGASTGGLGMASAALLLVGSALVWLSRRPRYAYAHSIRRPLEPR